MPIIDTDKPKTVYQYADVFEELLKNRERGYTRKDTEKGVLISIPFQAENAVFQARCTFVPDKVVTITVKHIAKIAEGYEETALAACEIAEASCQHLNFALSRNYTISVKAASIFYVVENQDFSWILALETISLYNEIVSAIQTYLSKIWDAAGYDED